MMNDLLVNLLNPPVLFFFLGLLAIALKSDLDIPQPLPKLFSLYLLLSIGFKGGVELRVGGLDAAMALTLLTAVSFAIAVPFVAFWVMKPRVGAADAAAIAATYGSVSAVTFITATSLLATLQIPSSGYMVAAMALMESPAIIVGVALARRAGIQSEGREGNNLWREAFFGGSVLLLMGSLVIGLLTGEEGYKSLKPFTTDIFKGILCLFLLDMGLLCGRRLSGGWRALGGFSLGFALIVPLINAFLGGILARMLGLEIGNAFLLVTLCASASYIAVPAAMRGAVPQANPGRYVTMALAITFPFNVLVGLPLYLGAIRAFWGA
jgi:hypothetical protein